MNGTLRGVATVQTPQRWAWPRHPLLRVVLAGLLLVLAGLAYVATLQPSNERDWEFGMETLAAISIQDNTVSIQNIRDHRATEGGLRTTGYVSRTYAADQIERAWLVVEPFTIGPLADFKGVAHTYFVFDFQDQPPVAVSVEARRERGESYDIFRGALNQYDLIYIWGTEQDLTGRRAVVEQHTLSMYPLRISPEGARELFLQMARATEELQTRPRFYNSLSSNCTNELAYAANRVQPGAIPPNVAFVLPGYAADVLYDLGFIPNDVPLAELEQRSNVTDLVLATHEREDFSSVLREELAKRYRL